MSTNANSNGAPMPGRGELFADPGARAVWAAVITLPVSKQHRLLQELQLRLQAASGASRNVRVRRLVGALVDAARLLGHSPSVREYKELRERNRDAGWPDEASIRRWAGGSWNDALRLAGLGAVADGDAVVIELGSPFEPAEVIAAVKACAKELGRVPSIYLYLAWAKRPDVAERYPRLPRSQNTVDACFGRWTNLLVQAGLVDSEGAVEIPGSSRVRAGVYFLTDEKCLEALREVAGRIGRSPRTTEYAFERKRVIEESRQQGKLRTLPSLNTIQKRWPTWDDALRAAELQPLGGRNTSSSRRGPGVPIYTTEELLAVLRQSAKVVGIRLPRAKFNAWREVMLDRDEQGRPRNPLPDASTIAHHFGGSWTKAVEAAKQ